LTSDVEWAPLNPARGDASPSAGTLWGDRAAEGASGFLVQFQEGFSSPPHIHNVTYRGVVIEGRIHNDDPGAANMWLPAGSFWTQPAGEAHITSAEGAYNMAYIEIDDGPYLVEPTENAFNNGERPVNLDRSNLVWLDTSDLSWVEQDSAAEVAFLWGGETDTSARGTLVKLPAGQSAGLCGDRAELKIVSISGESEVQIGDARARHDLVPGSFVASAPNAADVFVCSAGTDCLLYVRSKGNFEITSIRNRS
jgi:mannose-6-phosphate isomerase-like protein (cupin superfamily)